MDMLLLTYGSIRVRSGFGDGGTEGRALIQSQDNVDTWP